MVEKAELSIMGLFPACAGVIPVAGHIGNGICAFPRIRGGDPQTKCTISHTIAFSPHTRG